MVSAVFHSPLESAQAPTASVERSATHSIAANVHEASAKAVKDHKRRLRPCPQHRGGIFLRCGCASCRHCSDLACWRLSGNWCPWPPRPAASLRLRKLCKTHPPVSGRQARSEKIQPMKQTALDLNLSLKKTRKREFLEQMERVVPWAALVELIAPYYPQGLTGRPPFFAGDHAANSLHAAMVHAVGPWHARSLLRYPAVPRVCPARCVCPSAR